MPDSFDGFCSYGESGSRGRMRGMHPQHQPFSKNAFDAYNFSIISNFFDSDKLYNISTHNQKCVKKMQHIWLSTRNWGQKILTKFA